MSIYCFTLHVLCFYVWQRVTPTDLTITKIIRKCDDLISLLVQFVKFWSFYKVVEILILCTPNIHLEEFLKAKGTEMDKLESLDALF